MKRLLAVLTCVVMVFSLLTGCTEDSAPGTADLPTNKDSESAGQNKPDGASADSGEKIMRLATWSGPSGAFNPALMNNDYDADVINLTNEPLLMINQELELEPCLAESYEFTEDGKGVVFHLRENARWHDGQPFTAEDVKYTFEFIAHKDYVGFYSSYPKSLIGYEDFHSGSADGISGLEIVDDHTIRMLTSDPIGSSLENLGYWVRIFPKHMWEGVAIADAPNQSELLKNPIGTGPFTLLEFVPDQYTILEKNPDYWAGEPKLDKVVLQVTNAETVEAQALKGDIDFFESISLSPDDVKMYEEKGFKTVLTPLLSYQQLAVNTRNPLLGIKEVRQAIMYAIDRQGIVDSTIYGFGNVANTVYPPYFWAYPGDDQLNSYDYNPDKAVEMLTDQVGWEYKDGKMYADGEPVRFTLIYPSGQKARELAAPIIQENLKNVGIEVELNIMEFTTVTSKMLDGDDGYDMAILGSGYGTDADVRMFFHTESIENSRNYTKYSNPELDKLMDEVKQYNTREEKKPITDKIAKLMNEELPTIFLYNGSRTQVLSPRLNGVKPSSFTNYYKANEWYFEE